MKFNQQQLEAINHYKNPCCVISSAGSGKSTVLVNRIKNLIDVHNVPEHEILTITFTRNTGDELKSKLKKMGYTDVNVGTFHSICRRILFQEGINVSDEKMIKDWQVESLFKKIDEDVNVKDVRSFIGYQKNYYKSYDDNFIHKESKHYESELRNYFKVYEEFKQRNKLFDFDDLLIECYKVLKSKPNKYKFDFILVDEHQDSNLIQNMLIKEWINDDNIFVVFDIKQAIYAFRGSNPEYCINFENEWKNTKVIDMNINYRSDRKIVENANNFIKKYYGNYKHYSDAIPYSENEGHVEINEYFHQQIEAVDVANKIEELLNNKVKPNEIAVLYRLNSSPIYIENELHKREIKYDISGESHFFKRKEINAILAYLKLINNPHDDKSFETIFKFRNYPLAYFQNTVLKDARTFAGRNNLSLYESFITMEFKQYWQNKNVIEFDNNLNRLRLQKDKGLSVAELIENVKKIFQLEEYIESKYSDEDEAKERLETIEILKTFAEGYTLNEFIDYVEGDDKKKKIDKSSKDKIKLMTVHASKGLEFEHVFLIGVEDGKFPYEKGDELEEARLFYVSTTRAKNNLYISDFFNSRFVNEYLN